MGMADWFRAQEADIDAAVRKAEALHASFGRRALPYMRDELITAESRSQRRELKQIIRVLKQMPVRPDAHSTLLGL